MRAGGEFAGGIGRLVKVNFLGWVAEGYFAAIAPGREEVLLGGGDAIKAGEQQ